MIGINKYQPDSDVRQIMRRSHKNIFTILPQSNQALLLLSVQSLMLHFAGPLTHALSDLVTQLPKQLQLVDWMDLPLHHVFVM